MTIAQGVIKATEGASAFSLDGYAVFQGQLPARKTFPPGKRLVPTKRNAAGRCTYAKVGYDDGSILEFKWHPDRGVSLREVRS